jgi:uncharacterized LabA/DUF88 family protein
MREKKYAIYIDGSNNNKATKAAGYRLDFDKVKAYYANLGTVVDAVYFTALPPKEEWSPIRPLVEHLQYHGWTVITKETKKLLSEDGIFWVKGDMDGDIMCRAFDMVGVITHLVLFTGDGDFVPLIELMKRKGIHVSAVSHFSHGSDCTVSNELRKSCEFWPLSTMRQHFENTKPPKSKDDIEARRRKFLDGK